MCSREKHTSALTAIHHKITAATHRASQIRSVGLTRSIVRVESGGFAKKQHLGLGEEIIQRYFCFLIGLFSPVSCFDHCDKSSCTVSLKLRFKCV